jgi:uncharacterized membrane protein
MLEHVTVLSTGVSQLAGSSILAHLLDAVIFLANLTGGLVVGVGTLRGLIFYLRDLFTLGPDVPRQEIRLSLGRSLALALEFQLGADIVSTAQNPTRNDILVLASIIVLRTVLNFFLQRELREAAKREPLTMPSR